MDCPDEAREAAGLALEVDPENVKVLKWLADHRCARRWVRGEEGKATRNLIRKLLAFAPDTADVHETVAYHHVARGEWDKGIADLRAFIDRFPKRYQAWRHYACWLHKTGAYEEAGEAIMAAHLLCPDDVGVIKIACEILPYVERQDALASVVEKALERSPPQWGIWAAAGAATIHSLSRQAPCEASDSTVAGEALSLAAVRRAQSSGSSRADAGSFPKRE